MSIVIRTNVEAHMEALKRWLKSQENVKLEEMSDFFSKRVMGYEEHMSVWKDAYVKMSQLVSEDTKQLLDLGCGTGLELDCIFQRFPQLTVTGIDLSESMLQRLKEKHGDRELSLICADYFEYEYEAEKYDMVISFESLHHFTAEKKLGLYRKIYCTLKPGGCFVECDYIACCDEEEQILYQESQRKRIKEGIAEGQFIHFDTPLTLEHEVEVIKKAEFTNVEVIDSINGATFVTAIKGRR